MIIMPSAYMVNDYHFQMNMLPPSSEGKSYFPSPSIGSHMELTSTVEWLTACTVRFCSVLKYTISLHFTVILTVIN